MNQHLKSILDIIQRDQSLPVEEKKAITTSLKEADKELEITAFKLDRTEKVKRTTSILLEETIEELEQKRRAVEAQNRELEIEAALERVRARAMSMQASEELNALIGTVFTELTKLDLVLIGSVIMIFDSETNASRWYMVNAEAPSEPLNFFIKYHEHPPYLDFIKAWKERKLKWQYELKGNIKKEWDDFLFNETELALIPAPVITGMRTPERILLSTSFNNFGCLNVGTLEPLNDEQFDILLRFAKVFDLAYTRFNDLQTAEAQVRESRIQLALERVRAKTMAMQKSDELPETSKILFEQMKELGEPAEQMSIGIVREENNVVEISATLHGDTLKQIYWHSIDEPYMMRRIYNAWKAQQKTLVVELKGEELNAYNRYRNELTHTEMFATDLGDESRRIVYAAFFSKGMLAIGTNEPRPPGSLRLLERFASVFDLTYTRFLDLQKAEAQAREATIQLALERVRAKSLAMHHTSELQDVVNIVAQQLHNMGMDINGGVIIAINDEADENIPLWAASGAADYIQKVVVPFLDRPIFRDLRDAIKRGNNFFVAEYSEKEKIEFFQHLFNYPPWNLNSEERKKQLLSREGGLTRSGAISRHTSIAITNHYGKKFSDEENEILKRFGKVFEQTYTRFLDLQKAEEQAREAKIEAALERVRSKAMAMHKSEDLNHAVAVVFDELENLGLGMVRCGIGILNKEKRTTNLFTTSKSDAGTTVQLTGDESMDLHPLQRGSFNAWLKGEDFSYVLKGKELEEYYQSGADTNFDLPNSQRLFSAEEGTEQYYHVSMFQCGGLYAFRDSEFPEEAKRVMKRFAGVFNLTYNRFLDLQKAEAQAREAKIEAALERVRARTMAMQRSDELSETAEVLFQQFKQLGEDPLQITIGTINEAEGTVENRITDWGDKGSRVNRSFTLSLEEPALISKEFNAWKENKTSIVIDLTGKELENWINYRNKIYGIPVTREDIKGRRVVSSAFFSSGLLSISTPEPPPQETIQLLERFAKVFDLTYTRFNDLKQAEAQAREAKIEASLERVRARAMAMQKSQDLADAVQIVFEELDKLNLGILRCGIGILNKDKRSADVWTTTKSDNDTVVQVSGDESMDIHPLLRGAFDAWLSQTDYSYVLKGDDLNDYYKALTGVNFRLPDSQSLVSGAEGVEQYYYNAIFSSGGLFAFSETELPEEAIRVMKRFAGVFNLTYNRFLDLQKAESQAREATIEAALERVRSRTMAMHDSEDVSAATATMFAQLEKLGIENLRCGITIIDKNKTQEVWSVSNVTEMHADNTEGQKIVIAAGTFDMNAHPLWRLIYDGWENNEDYVNYYLAGTDKEDYFKILNAAKGYLPQSIQQFPDTYFQVYFFGEGAVWSCSLQPHSDEQKQIMRRFTSVFSLTFRRYQDLQKAEAQAREATIEAALERVRGKALAMHNSNDLSSTASMVFTELRKLGITPLRCGVGLLNKESRRGQLYSATSSAEGDSLALVGWVELSGHPVLENIYDTWVRNEDYFPELSGKQLKSYYDLLLKGLSVKVPDWEDGQKQYGSFLPFAVGCLYAWSENPYSETEIKILKRFATIIDLTFRRYMDLQKSETSAKQAIKQAALDRIRADIASMRTVTDLERITPLIWNELTILGVPFIRCGIFIMNDAQKLIHTFLSTPDGRAIAAFHLPYSTHGNIQQVLKHWQDKKIYVDHWDESAFTEFADILVEQGGLASAEHYLKTIPHGGFYLHFLPFLQGMLYVGNSTQLDEEEIKLVQSVADAFSTAYSRYEDFNKLEAAKKQVDSALDELRVTQKQLIQSEKMASLGELTAGIAHEIQNPLNFVNNFSEVNKELLAEMVEEIKKGNYDAVKVLAKDVEDNQEKINHHGKRAEAIVKGMLQHSRTSSGIKEPTNINTLADEYLRLAYHGLRAKDKSFNALLKTDYDPGIGAINIIPQDIGRVILNLITNAFYAVTAKKKQQKDKYEPTVSVATKKAGDKVLISVKDNGNGIPQKIIDKIFQPFFTTKPAGQGTGLGLSLSYDIVKAHGGEIKVETNEGEGTEFIISLSLKM